MRPRGRVARALPTAIVLAAAVGLIPVKMALNHLVGEDIGYIPSLMVVILGAWLGFIPGLVATIAVAIVEATVFLEPRGGLAVASSGDALRLALLGTAGLLASWLAWLRSRAERAARAATDDALEAQARADLMMRRLAALQALASELGGAITTAQIPDALVAQAGIALRADSVTAFLLDPDGTSLTAVAWSGHTDGSVSRTPLSIAEPLPPTDVARTGDSVFIEDPAESFARYGAAYSRLGISPVPRACAVVPMDSEGHRFGVLSITWNDAHDLKPDRRAYIASIARLGAAAFERARLLDAERRARQRAEAVQQHLDLLAEAGRVFGLSLEYELLLRQLARIALPSMGDVGIVDVLDRDAIRRVVAAAGEDLVGAAGVVESQPPRPARGGPIADALADGGAAVIAVDDRVIEALAPSADHVAALRTIGARWLLATPLRVRSRTIGVLTLLRREDRPYDPEEVAVVEELGDRAGRALENARLHRQVARLADREQRHAAELEAVVGAIGEGILVADPDGMIRSSNAAAVRLLGGPVTSMDGVLDLLQDTSGQRPSELAAGPTEYRLASRTTAWIEIATYAIPAAEALDASSSVIVCRDVTAFRQGQALREAFLGLLSHELRTPVTTIYGGSSVLTRPGGRLAQKTQDDILEDIAGEADRLYRLVEDLMVLARFDEGIDLGAEPILLQHLVPVVADQESARWPGLRVSCEIAPELPMVGGDETSITQVLRNLLSNAAKYSPSGSEIRVIAEPALEGVRVRVLDEGPGVDPDEVDHLFDPFYRAAATAQLAAGAGIGLYVSRRLVDAMGGRIWAAPRPDRGSEFAFVLPRYRSDGEDG